LCTLEGGHIPVIEEEFRHFVAEVSEINDLVGLSWRRIFTKIVDVYLPKSLFAEDVNSRILHNAE
jgi:hypothetical protein